MSRTFVGRESATGRAVHAGVCASPRRARPCDWQQNALKAPTPHARACTRMLPSDRNRVPSQDPLAGLQTGRTCSCARLQAKYARHSRRAAGRGQTITAQGRTPYQQCQAHPINSCRPPLRMCGRWDDKFVRFLNYDICVGWRNKGHSWVAFLCQYVCHGAWMPRL